MNGGTRHHSTRERIIAAEVMKLERRQARQRAAAKAANANRPRVLAQVFLESWPEDAFGTFVEELGFGLRTIGSPLIQPETGRYLRFRRDASGRFAEVYDAVAGEGLELGRVTVWSPGGRLALTWREPDWPEGASTDVDVRFEPIFGGTLVRIEHSGFERVGPKAPQAGAGYQAAWTAALGWVARRARARGTAEVGR
ncbi:MAG TPA: SRPBCC domain-containing protein [Thermoleophilaceae bacterium]